MKIGVSTACLFPEFTERALQQLADAGVKNVEIFFNSPSETTVHFAKKLRKIADAQGVSILSAHPCTSEYEGSSFFGRYPRRFDDAAEDYKRLFESCAVLGAEVVAFHGARAFLPISQSLYFERFGKLSEIAKTFSVRLCQENVVNFFSQNPDFIAEMRRQLPEVQLLFDVKQAFRTQLDPMDMLRAMGTNLAHVHASDHTAERDCIPPGTGNFDFAAMMAHLRQQQYEGAVMVELYRTNFESIAQLVAAQGYLGACAKG